MKKSLFIALVCAAVVCAMALPSFAAPKAPKDMVYKAPAGITATQGPVAFSHAKHEKATKCQDCHHKWDGKSDKIGGCSGKGCHDQATVKEGSKDVSFKDAFHRASSKHSCVGCHKANKAAGKTPNGPVAPCTKCHAKKQ